MSGEVKILFWWLLFGGTHILGSAVPLRTFLIGRLGLKGFKTLYSVVALATFLPLCLVFAANKHAGESLDFVPSGPVVFWTVHVLVLLSMLFLVQAQFVPNPMTTLAEMSRLYGADARGIQRITRHPMNTAVVLLGLAHVLVNPFVGDWVFFGGFVVYGVLSALHQDRRTRATGPEEVRRFQDETSLVPFAAILAGRQRLALGELSLVAAGIAVVLFLLLRFFHGSLFGGF
jgi:uncharacterized membrane protein